MSQNISDLGQRDRTTSGGQGATTATDDIQDTDDPLATDDSVDGDDLSGEEDDAPPLIEAQKNMVDNGRSGRPSAANSPVD